MFRGQKKAGLVSTFKDKVLTVDSEYVVKKIISGRVYLETDLKNIKKFGQKYKVFAQISG